MVLMNLFWMASRPPGLRVPDLGLWFRVCYPFWEGQTAELWWRVCYYSTRDSLLALGFVDCVCWSLVSRLVVVWLGVLVFVSSFSRAFGLFRSYGGGVF